jgi:hypothetical protein
MDPTANDVLASHRDQARSDSADEGNELPDYADVRDNPAATVNVPPTNPTQFANTDGSPLQTEHMTSLTNSKGRPWLFLKVTSRAGQAKSLPVFFHEDVIKGSVETDLDKAESSKGVTITVRVEQ